MEREDAMNLFGTLSLNIHETRKIQNIQRETRLYS
jgi:hypothetical protein